MDKDGIVKPEFYDELEATEKEYGEILKELEILWEEEQGIKDRTNRLVEKRDEFNLHRRYDVAGKVIENHKYWATDDLEIVAKITSIQHYYVKYLVTGSGGVDTLHSSSPVGVIVYNYPIPISEWKYNEIRDKWVKKLGYEDKD